MVLLDNISLIKLKLLLISIVKFTTLSMTVAKMSAQPIVDSMSTVTLLLAQFVVTETA